MGLTFTALDSPELALRRVATRVSLGGHDVPEAVVRRRWVAGLRSLFDLYLPVVDRWLVFDSSDGSLRQIADGGREGPVNRIFDEERWTRLLRLATQAGASAARPDGELFDPVAPVHDDRNSEPQEALDLQFRGESNFRHNVTEDRRNPCGPGRYFVRVNGIRHETKDTGIVVSQGQRRLIVQLRPPRL